MSGNRKVARAPFCCAEFDSCTEDYCAYPGDEFCEHDLRAAAAEPQATPNLQSPSPLPLTRSAERTDG